MSIKFGPLRTMQSLSALIVLVLQANPLTALAGERVYLSQNEVATTGEASDESAAVVTLSNQRPRQGETIEVKVSGGANPPPPAEFDKNSYKFFATPGDTTVYTTLVTIPVVVKPGPKSIKVGDKKMTLTVVDSKFPVQHLTLPKSKNNFDTAKGEEEAVDKAKATLSDQRFWHGNFTVPSPARVSAGFGLRRVVNGVLLDDYFHSGLDYAGYLGTPVKAVAPGRVVLAVSKGFKLHGNTIAIDHGQGVVSFYIHLQKVHVKEGDMVKQGQLIGAVGQTGRANGPHLHFSIYVNKVASNPWQWYRKAL